MNGFARVSCQHRSLHCSAIGNCFVRVDALAEFLSIEEILDELLDFRDPGGASYKHYLVDLALADL